MSEIYARYGKPNPPFIDRGTFVTTCSSCYPNKTIIKEFPHLEGKQISHSLCPFHFQQIMVALEECDCQPVDGDLDPL